MNFLHMRYFIAVAKAGSFSLAAGRLYITQQTISAHIAQLERELGQPLFERTRPLTLTPAGKCFLRRAKEMLLLNSEMQRELQDLTNPDGHIFKIGVSHTYARTSLPQLLAQFYARCPEANIQIYEMSYENMEEALTEHYLDCIITRPPYTLPNLKIIPLHRWDDVLLFAPRCSLEKVFGAETDAIMREMETKPTLALVKDCPFILPRAGTVRSNALKMMMEAEISPIIRIETDTMETAIFLCRKGLGLTISPKQLIQAHAGRADFHPIKNSYFLSTNRVEHWLALCYLEPSQPNILLNQFIATARQYAAENESVTAEHTPR